MSSLLLKHQTLQPRLPSASFYSLPSTTTCSVSPCLSNRRAMSRAFVQVGQKEDKHQAPQLADANDVSPCCLACSKLSQNEAVLMKADCSECPAKVMEQMKSKVTKMSNGDGGCCGACAQLSKSEQKLLKAECTGC